MILRAETGHDTLIESRPHDSDSSSDETRARILDAARRYFHPDHMAIVAVGPAAELAPQMEEIGLPVTVWEP